VMIPANKSLGETPTPARHRGGAPLPSVLVMAFLLVLGAGGGGTVSGTAFAQAPADVVRVEAVEIVGNENVKEKTILKQLSFAPGEEISVPDDLLRAEEALRRSGLFREVTADYRMGEEGIVVLLQVVENPLIEEIDIRGNRDWNEDRRIVIPGVNWSLRWPFTNYLVSPDRIEEIFKEHGVEPGQVLNERKLFRALGISRPGLCPGDAPENSLCGEYVQKGYFLVGISEVQPGRTIRVRIVEYVFEDVEVEGVTGPFREKALTLLEALPRGKPVKLQEFQLVLQRLAQSLYFEPLQQEDLRFAPGSAPDRVVLVLSLRPRVLLEEPVSVRTLVFRGNTVFPAATLQRRVRLPEGPVDNFALLAALEEVYRLYRKEGYLFVKFATEERSGDTLIVRVDEGRLEEIEIRQNGYTTARLDGEGFERLPLGATVPDLALDSPPEEAEEEGELHPLLVLLERFSQALGEFLGTANEGGRPRTDPQIILKELTLRPGDLVNQFRLAETYRRLLDLGYFQDVRFDFQPLGEDGYRLVLEVTEQDKLGSLNGGLSFSADGLIGQLSVNGKNLYGTGQDLSVQLDRGILGKAITNWSVDYKTRTLLDFAEYLQIKLFNNTSQERSPEPYLLQRLGVESSLAYPWQGIRTTFGWRLESFTKQFGVTGGPRRDPFEEFEGQGQALDVDFASAAGEDETDEPSRVERGLTNAVSLAVVHDSRNNPLFATRGGVHSARIERAGLFGVGTEDFLKLSSTLIQFFPTWEDQTVALRAVGGLGMDLPAQEFFSLGGATSLRGIEPRRTPAMAFVNVEYRVQVAPMLVQLALFLDAGTDGTGAWFRSMGIEGRVNVPYLGWLRLALAWPLEEGWTPENYRVEVGFGPFF